MLVHHVINKISQGNFWLNNTKHYFDNYCPKWIYYGDIYPGLQVSLNIWVDMIHTLAQSSRIWKFWSQMILLPERQVNSTTNTVSWKYFSNLKFQNNSKKEWLGKLTCRICFTFGFCLVCRRCAVRPINNIFYIR